MTRSATPPPSRRPVRLLVGGRSPTPPATARYSAFSRRRGVAAACAAALLVAMAGCASDGGGTTGSDEACEPSGGKVELTFWSWVPGIKEAVDLWNGRNPGIQVAVEETPQGNQGTYAKMFNALKAKQAPDLGQIEYDTLPQFRVQQGLKNIASCPGVAQAESRFVDWTWRQSSVGGGGVFAVPQDTGPMALFYRKDLFAEHDVKVPTTWAEYAQAARTLHEADPELHIAHFPQKDVNWYAGLVWQAGGRWFTQNGEEWTVDLGDPASRKVAGFWQDLIGDELVADLQGFSESWNKALDSGHIATWPAAAWGAETIRTAAPSTSGKWAVAPLPQWRAGEQKSGNWGGSTTAVLAGSAHPAEAAKFALWLNTAPEALAITTAEGGLYPATVRAQQSLSPSEEITEFYGGQQVYEVFRQASRNVSQNFTWGPAMQKTYDHARGGFAGALNGSTTLDEVMAGTTRKTIEDLRRQSIPVAGQ